MRKWLVRIGFDPIDCYPNTTALRGGDIQLGARLSGVLLEENIDRHVEGVSACFSLFFSESNPK